MAVQAVGVGAQIHQRTVVAQVQGATPVGRLRGLLERQQPMPEAAFARAVGAEDHRERREIDPTGVLPSLEVLQVEGGEHGELQGNLARDGLRGGVRNGSDEITL